MTINNADYNQKKLSDQQKDVLLGKATETPFSGKWLHNEEEGKYVCAACGNVLFDSVHKFESGSGWPSFYDAASSNALKLKEDRSQGLQRVEVTCGKCGGHLGHVFHDAPDQPTGLRFCVNSCALDFAPQKPNQKSDG